MHVQSSDLFSVSPSTPCRRGTTSSPLFLLIRCAKVEISFKDGDLVNLTQAWKANGSNPSKKAAFWLRNDSSQELIEALAEKLKVEKSQLCRVDAGRYGGANQVVKEWVKES